jgi:nucleoside-triphosphatase THEP1
MLNESSQGTITSTAVKKKLQIAGDLGTANSTAIERLKQKLEEKTLKNYETVLEDVRKQLTTFSPD